MSDELPPKQTVDSELETKDLPPAEEPKKGIINTLKDKIFSTTQSTDDPVRGETEHLDEDEDTADNPDYGVKVIDQLSIDYKPTIVICSVSEALNPGLYFISNINDVMINQQIWIASGFIEYRGDHRIELVVMNLVDEWFTIPTDFNIAYLIPFNE